MAYINNANERQQKSSSASDKGWIFLKKCMTAPLATADPGSKLSSGTTADHLTFHSFFGSPRSRQSRRGYVRILDRFELHS